LDLNNNKLCCIPYEIGNLINMTTLDLSLNQLTSIPKEIGNLKQLKTLDLCDNQLHWIPTTLGRLYNTKLIIRLSENPLNFKIDRMKECSNNILKYLNNIYYVKLSFCLGFNKKVGLNSPIYKYFYNNQNLFDINLIPLIFKYIN
jgi:Leucine-rich repeat (LRR) protein